MSKHWSWESYLKKLRMNITLLSQSTIEPWGIGPGSHPWGHAKLLIDFWLVAALAGSSQHWHLADRSLPWLQLAGHGGNLCTSWFEQDSLFSSFAGRGGSQPSVWIDNSLSKSMVGNGGKHFGRLVRAGAEPGNNLSASSQLKSGKAKNLWANES